MLGGNISIDEVNTRSLQRETPEITSLLNQFPTNTNVLVVDTDFTTLLNMKQIMRQFGYQVTIESDAEKAFVFLSSCKHEFNIVIWDFHMPEIDGLQALEIIGSKMNLPVVIMSDDIQTESVMKATIHGACDYVLKPVRNDVIANIWQHIVRKKIMSKPNTILPVQSYLAQSDGLEQIDQEQNIDKRAGKRPKITWSGGIQSDGFNEDNIKQNFEKKVEKRGRKPRMTWTDALDNKFREAIDIVGGIERANPKLLLKCLQEMEIEGLTRNSVANHLHVKKKKINAESQNLQQTQDIGCSTAYAPAPSPQGSNNDHTSISPYRMSGLAVNPIQQNPFQNGYLTTNNNQFITNPLPRLPSFDHLLRQPQQQQYQSSPQFNYVMNNEEPAQASDIYAPDLELSYPSLPYM